MSVENRIANIKVIAAGCTVDGRLRATVSLTPAYVAENVDELSRWPSEMINWLAEKKQDWGVTLCVLPIKYRDKSSSCPTPPDECAKHLVATATGLRLAWESRGNWLWLDQLWQNAFTVQGTTHWKTLAKLIGDSSSGNSMQQVDNPREPQISTDSSLNTKTLLTSDPIKIASILPARQSELAFMLECKRVLELCDTMCHAAGERDATWEAKCSEAAQNSNIPASGTLDGGTEGQGICFNPLKTKELYEAARQRFDLAKEEVKNSYEGLICDAMPSTDHSVKSGAINTSTLSDRVLLEEAVQDPLDSHQAAHTPQYDEAAWTAHKESLKRKITDESESCPTLDVGPYLSQRYFQIQGSPALSRLFALTFDVYFSAKELSDILNADQTDKGQIGEPQFAYISVKDGSLCRIGGGNCIIYTLAKFRLQGSQPHFWPASRAEVKLGPHPSVEAYHKLSQYDGMMITAQRVSKPGSSDMTAARFDLSSLDVRAAAEAAIDRRVMTNNFSDVEQQYKNCTLASRPMATARKTHLTGGITLLDRGRQAQAVGQFAARNAHGEKRATGRTLLDAEDLTIGYRIDVGVPVKNSDIHAWRPLMARELRHGHSGRHADRVRAVIPWLFRASEKDIDDEWRKRIEDGVLALPARLIPRNDNSGHMDAFVEEAIVSWDGDPMAVQTAGERATKCQVVESMPVGTIVSPPTASREANRCPSPLRFGYSYEFGIRAVFAGGLSISLDVAKTKYLSRSNSSKSVDSSGPAEVDGDALTVPSAINVAAVLGGIKPRSRDRLKRFLRQERIDAPFLLLPATIATRRQGDMGYERAAHVIVRSTVIPHNRNRARPTITQRVFVVPSVSSSFAALHGVCDKFHTKNIPQGLSAPVFGPRGVRFDSKGGGFPSVKSEAIIGLDGAHYDKARTISGRNDTGDGDLVYDLAVSEQKRDRPYYPDPAAEFYAIGVRYAGTDMYLEGSCVVPIYDGRNFPDARPLALTIRRTDRRRNPRPELSEVLVTSKQGGGGIGGLPRIPGSVEAILSIAPGEDFEVDVWCIPGVAKLVEAFALIDGIGAVAVATQPKMSPPSRGSLLSALEVLLPKSVISDLEKLLPSDDPNSNIISDWQDGNASVGGLPGAGPKTLGAIAKAIHKLLCRRPLDEISAVRTIRATHAVDRPLANPLVSLPHVSLPKSLCKMANIELKRPDFTIAEKSGSEFCGIGHVAFHLPTTGSLEIRAQMVSPTSKSLDDMRRGRSLRDRRNGLWPQSSGGKAVSFYDVFGFNVLPNGDVEMKSSEVTLQQLDDIPLAPLAEESRRVVSAESQCQDLVVNDDGYCMLSLDQFLGLEKPLGNCGTSKLPFQFSDRLARQLKLTIRAYPRHAEQMRTAGRDARNGYWLRDGEPLEMGSPDSNCDESPFSCSAEVPVWLDAGVRPAKPVALSPVPAFVWSKHPTIKIGGSQVTGISRYSVIRIPLERPWFSSGEGERLGIVVWPPNISKQDPSHFALDRVELPRLDAKPGQAGRLLDLTTFVDDDLGAGGKFITRWGGDPIRRMPIFKDQALSLRTFVPLSAFRDLDPTRRMGFEAEVVTCVEMPIGREAQPGTESNEETVSDWLSVSLIAYRPKFDIESEQWYVDIAMEHTFEAEPFVRLGLVRYQPHAPRELQVSRPVIQWAQLMPNRHVEVRTTAGQNDVKEINVRVRGLSMAVTRADVAKTSDDVSISDSEREPLHKMTAMVVREHLLRSGVIERKVISTAGHSKPIKVVDPGKNGTLEMVFDETITIKPERDCDSSDRAKYSVFFEEREARLPATYLDEPVSAEAARGRDCKGLPLDDLLVEAGPRFLARIDI